MITSHAYSSPAQVSTSMLLQSPDAVPMKPPQQLLHFEDAVRLFNSRDFRGARDRFRDAAAGPKRDIAHRAGQYLSMCEQRLRWSGRG
jgi:hypothetical protein